METLDRPNAFEGVGKEGLPGCARKELYGMYTAIEVANVKHVYECTKIRYRHNMDRRKDYGKSFAVQEIADALQGVEIP
jgi:chorismate mutase